VVEVVGAMRAVKVEEVVRAVKAVEVGVGRSVNETSVP